MNNIAIIGATGNVGRKTLEVIEKKDIKFNNLFLVASSNSAGKKISFKEIILFVESFKKNNLKINEKKFQNSIKSTNFTNLKNKELNEGFEEGVHSKKNWKKNKFF